MLDTFKALVANQFEAALCALDTCVDRCPAAAWDGPVANLAFCQAVFHTVFYADYFLGPDADAFKRQAFHRENAAVFRDYEELEDRVQVLMYDKPTIKTYVAFCRQKASKAIAAETADTLSARCGFDWLGISRAELYVYAIRHIQHHAAQLSLRLRLNDQTDIPWVRSGWRRP